MNFLRSKVDHLADHLRGCIARGELADPLPNIRDWSEQLGVAHGTLESALKILKREGLIRSRPRKGIVVVRKPTSRPSLQQPPLVRWVVYGRNYQNVPTIPVVVGSVSQRLGAHGIRISLEMCNDARLRAIHRQGEHAHEMLLLPSLPKEYQALFADFGKSALLIGPPFPDIQLPFISNDVPSAIRHATYALSRRGFQRVSLVVNAGAQQPIDEGFSRICAGAPHPIQGEVVRLPDEMYEQTLAVQRLTARIIARHGLIVISPVPAASLMMASMKRGLRVPDDVEVISVNSLSQEIRTFPIPIHYPYPMDKFAKAVCLAAIHYFEQGAVPPLRKLIPLHMVSPPR